MSEDATPTPVQSGTAEQQLAWEAGRRPLVSRAAVAAGFLMLGGAVVEQFVVFAHYPSVGVIQGLTPALRGLADTADNPRIAIIRFLDHHAAGAVLWGAIGAIGTALMALALAYLYRATRFRRPALTPVAGRLAVAAPVAVGVLSLARLVALTITAHHFVTHSDHSRHAVDAALTPGSVVVIGYLAFVSSLALGFAVIVIALNAMRVGLLTRFMGVLGIFVGILEVIPQLASPLPVIQALWLISLGVLIAGGWPNGTPPAWAAGEARPWPSSQQQREAREAARADGGDEPRATVDPDTPEPVPAHPSSKKRKRKRRR